MHSFSDHVFGVCAIRGKAREIKHPQQIVVLDIIGLLNGLRWDYYFWMPLKIMSVVMPCVASI